MPRTQLTRTTMLTALAVPERLEGPRVVVRSWELDDAAAVHEAVTESRERHLLPWLPWAASTHRTVDDSLDFCARSKAQWLLREDLFFGIFDRANGCLLGAIGLSPTSWRARRFEIGYWLRERAVGHGFVSEAVQLVTALAFERLRANRVEIRCDAQNERSRRVAMRNGYVHEATLRCHDVGIDGSMRDTQVFAMVRPDYRAARLRWRQTEVRSPEPALERSEGSAVQSQT